MGFLQFFMPKDRVFYVLFNKIGDNILQTAFLFEDFVKCDDLEKRSLIFKELKSLERSNDELTQTLFVELGRNFITPFDREDIHNLASSLDEVINFIYACAKKINFYKISSIDPAILASIPPILDSTKAVQEGILALRKLKDTDTMSNCLKQISKAEKQADDVFDESIEALFLHTDDMKELIKKREVYQYLESITDQCKEVGKVLGTISIKYA